MFSAPPLYCVSCTPVTSGIKSVKGAMLAKHVYHHRFPTSRCLTRVLRRWTRTSMQIHRAHALNCVDLVGAETPRTPPQPKNINLAPFGFFGSIPSAHSSFFPSAGVEKKGSAYSSVCPSIARALRALGGDSKRPGAIK